MNYQIDKTLLLPGYIQLYRFLATDIAAGIYPYGSKLPSKRVIAEETGTSVITVEHAITLLNEEGFTKSRERSGVFVIYRGEDFLGDGSSNTFLPQEEAAKRRNPETKSGDLAGSETKEVTDKTWSGFDGQEPPLSQYTGEFPFSTLARTMRKVLLDYGEKILVKSPNHGCAELRSEICHYLARSRRIQVDPAQVIIGSGAEYLYGLIAQLLEDKHIAIENPSYSKIRKVYESMGVTCDMLTMKPDGLSSEDLAETKANVLHVTPFNSYPSGVTAGISKKLEYLRWAKRRGAILIEDNYDSELTVSRKVEEPLFCMDPDVDVIYLNTFSRTLAPSMRIGYMILPARLVERFGDKLGFYSCTVPIFDQFVLAELLKNGSFERHLNRIRRKKRKEKN